MSDLFDKLHDTYGRTGSGVSKTLYSQAFLATSTLMEAPGATVEDRIKWCTAKWYRDGLSPATITKRLNCLGKLGVPVAGLKPTKKPALKWWLKPHMKSKLMGHEGISQDLKDWVEWTTTTGLRIEETLRLRVADFEWERNAKPTPGHHFDAVAITVPGLKTHASQTTLPIGEAPRAIIARRMGTELAIMDSNRKLFDLTYLELVILWDNAMMAIGVSKQLDPTATLKALRRNAARYLHVDRKMPLDMVRQYLRHEDIQTTMGYLALTGGYGTEEMKGYL